MGLSFGKVVGGKGKQKKHPIESIGCFSSGAEDEARTRYLHLGKVALYQMSYSRNNIDYYSMEMRNVKYYFLIFCLNF